MIKNITNGGTTKMENSTEKTNFIDILVVFLIVVLFLFVF